MSKRCSKRVVSSLHAESATVPEKRSRGVGEAKEAAAHTREEEGAASSESDIGADAAFRITGAWNYARYANGTYVAVPNEFAFGMQIFQQIENPHWFVEFCPAPEEEEEEYVFDDMDEEDEFGKECIAERRKYLTVSRAYSGWVAKFDSLRGKRAGPLRTRTGSTNSHPVVAAKRGTQQFVLKDREMVAEETAEWHDPSTWGKNYNVPHYSDDAVSWELATYEEVQAAHALHKEMVAEIAAKGLAPKCFELSDGGDGGGLFIPIEGETRPDGRASYHTVVVRSYESYVEGEGEYYRLYYQGEGMGGRWYAEIQADGYAQSTPCCPVAAPEDVIDWDYDDGHYNHWGLNYYAGAKVQVCEDQERISEMRVRVAAYLSSASKNTHHTISTGEGDDDEEKQEDN